MVSIFAIGSETRNFFLISSPTAKCIAIFDVALTSVFSVTHTIFFFNSIMYENKILVCHAIERLEFFKVIDDTSLQ